jgi:hypothetical protein
MGWQSPTTFGLNLANLGRQELVVDSPYFCEVARESFVKVNAILSAVLLMKAVELPQPDVSDT